MAYAIINNYIPHSLYGLKSPYTMVPESITIHNTYNDATAINEIEYMHRNKTATSYHVAVDDKQVVQAIPFTRNAWHAGDSQGKGNRASIGIEICYSKSGGARYVAAEENAVEYIAHVLKQYGWGIDRVKWHRDWSGKNCPHRIFAEGRAQSVKNRIAKRLTELNNPHKPTPTTPKPKEEEVKVANVDKMKNAKPSKSLALEFDRAVKEGITDGTYPQRPGTREEMAVMVLRGVEKLRKEME